MCLQPADQAPDDLVGICDLTVVRVEVGEALGRPVRRVGLVQLQEKEHAVRELLDSRPPRTVWDLGANDGTFTRLASEQGIPSIAFDIDPAAVDQNYRQVKAGKEQNILAENLPFFICRQKDIKSLWIFKKT